jgi:hypothetical protein
MPQRRSQVTRESRRYTKAEMLAGGFEARCELLNGTRYLWSGSEGICLYPDGRARWIDDPAKLPECDWHSTEWGEEQITESD